MSLEELFMPKQNKYNLCTWPSSKVKDRLGRIPEIDDKSKELTNFYD